MSKTEKSNTGVQDFLNNMNVEEGYDELAQRPEKVDQTTFLEFLLTVGITFVAWLFLPRKERDALAKAFIKTVTK